MLALQAGGVGQRGIADGGAQIGEKLHVLAQAQQPGFRPRVIRDIVPFRSADRAEHHGVGLHRLGHGGVGDRLAMRVIGAAADQIVLDIERGGAGRVQPGNSRSTWP